MAVVTLIIGAILLGAGLLGHTFFTRSKRQLHPDEHKARRWVVTIGSLVAGLWLVAFSAAELLRHYQGQHH
jgi:cytochrome bd-type quinol oxidase subunit 1